MVAEWKEAQNKQQGGGQASSSRASGSRCGWKCPDPGWYKANVDAAIHEGSSQFRVGMVLRDDTGVFVAGMVKRFDENATVLEAEATGMYEVLQWVCGLGVSQVVVESDSLVVVDALNKNRKYVSEVGSIFESCRVVLQQRCDLKVQHVRRQANKVAHSIAKIPCMSGSMNCFSTPPPCVLELIVSDSFSS
ncbi:hypothetical protein POM88_008168 [Heracleum sosnowskyi]|uniref:RNase H type-1 domain-containing protein n=1 Tax=Heracleum sosnowskyi TaxID=360622 RepID=A0AAD8GR40_9APIA|nr:hypothetical protein POM88_051967 [Heracleum sosnowskyi]KAK1372664.1 hypothetical protein POM88_028857 [Heracleum sosnowskyi]KAK1387336.1 hypothetical protein POM88_015514 [Heracleum sosnowskyi]KAK1398305.1 hypothetical protein POM88_008168 [Heracleum sosnowskyi]